MVSNYYYSMNNYAYRPLFRAAESSAPLEKPIEVVQKTIEDSVNIFSPEPKDEEKRKNRNRAIWVASSVLVASTLVAILNPRTSGKTLRRIQGWQDKARIKLEKSGKNSFMGKLYRTGIKTSENFVKVFRLTNTFNAGKDMAVQKLLTQKAVKNPNDNLFLKIWKPIHTGIATVMKKPCEMITRGFDKVTRHTVTSGYNSAIKKMNKTDGLIKLYMEKLSPEEKKIVNNKLAEIAEIRKYFSKENTLNRLNTQEKMMSNLENDFSRQFGEFWRGFDKNNKSQWKKHIGDNMSFWAEDILQPKKDKLIKEGGAVVDKITGNADKKGLYNDIIDILASKLTPEEKLALEESVLKTSKKLKKSNWNECAEYFDKKRDLVLGSALSDGLGAIASLGLCGLAVGMAHSKEDRASRALTIGFPAIAGLGTSLVLAMRLVPGVKCLLLGGAIGGIMSMAGAKSGQYVAQHIKNSNNAQPQTNPFSNPSSITSNNQQEVKLNA